MEEKYIVAIDLGTSRTAIGVARVEGRTVNVLYYREHDSSGIKKGSVNNESTAAAVLAAAVEEAEKTLHIKIRKALVGMPKYPVMLKDWKAIITLDENEGITQEDIRSLMNIAREDCSGSLDEGDEVYCVIPQSYSDGEEFQIKEEDVIGLERARIEGYYKVVVGRKSLFRRIDKIFDRAGIIPIKKFTGEVTAQAVLSRSERETGVAMVDIGGGATSVSIYTDNVLRYYGSIPFGGKAVTEDIRQECAIGGHLAENIKKGFGVCLPGRLQNLSDKKIQIRSNNSSDDKQIAVKFISEIITARMEEICDAVLYLIQDSRLYDELRSGIVLTGGGACLANVANLFTERSGYGIKVGYPNSGFDFSGEETGSHDPGAAVVMGLLMEGCGTDVSNCAEELVPGQEGSFQDIVKKAAGAGRREPESQPEADGGEEAPGDGTLFGAPAGTEAPADGTAETREGRDKEGKGKPRKEKTPRQPKGPGIFDSLKNRVGNLFSDDGSDENMA